MQFHYTRSYREGVRLVIFDWAGTTVDYGCQAPIAAFVKGFEKMGVNVSYEVARGPMGMEKRDHIATVAAVDEVAAEWQKVHGKPITDEDIDTMYEDFVSLLLEQIAEQSSLLPGIKETVTTLRDQQILVGSSTGYFTEAADIVAKGAAKEGYIPDFKICASDVPAGRPYPWMIYRTMEELGVCPPEAVVNVGDTPIDIESALNAGVWSVGVAATGNQMGLTEEECKNLTPDAYEARLKKARSSLLRAGAHYVIDTMDELVGVIDDINSRLAVGDKP